jgi:hypothetical protein
MVYLVLRSITYAQRGKNWLTGRGISSHVMRLPISLGKNGCGYCLRIGRCDLERALDWLETGSIPVIRVYGADHEGYWEIKDI